MTPMLVRITKGDGKPDVLTCIRDDGSSTWSAVGASVGIVHDLVHYAVETSLGLTSAFFGMLAAGRDIDSFGTRDGRKDTYPAQAIFAEHLVGMIQLSLMDGSSMDVDAIHDEIDKRIEELGLHVDVPTVVTIAVARDRAVELVGRWGELKPDQTLELPFDARNG